MKHRGGLTDFFLPASANCTKYSGVHHFHLWSYCKLENMYYQTFLLIRHQIKILYHIPVKRILSVKSVKLRPNPGGGSSSPQLPTSNPWTGRFLIFGDPTHIAICYIYVAICVLLFNLWRSQLWRCLDLAHGAKWSRGTAAHTTHQLCPTTSALKLLLLQRWSWERKSLNSAPIFQSHEGMASQILLTPGNMPLSCSDKN